MYIMLEEINFFSRFYCYSIQSGHLKYLLSFSENQNITNDHLDKIQISHVSIGIIYLVI